MEKKTKSETLPPIRVAGRTRENLEKLAVLDKRTLTDYIRIHLETLAETLKSK